MSSSGPVHPLSDHFFQLLIAQSGLQTCSSQLFKNNIYRHLSVLQKQLNSSPDSALALEDRIYSSTTAPSCPEEAHCGRALPRGEQYLEFSSYGGGSQDESMAALQSFLSSSATEEALAMDDLYSSDEFRMFEFKVRRCTRGRSHDWTECPFAHPGEKARRRDPRRFHYSGTACADFRKGSCKRGDDCEFAHGVFECWLHPARYRTQPCKDGVNCRRRVCFFAHTAQELRVLPAPSVGALKSPGSARSLSKNLQFGMLHCSLDDHCTICATSAIQSSSPVSTLINLPESPPSLSPPLSPPSPAFFAPLELSLAGHSMATRQKLARHLSIPSGDQTSSLLSFLSAPSSPSAGSFLPSPGGSANGLHVADLTPAAEQQQSAYQKVLQAHSFCSSSPSLLRRAIQTMPCSFFMPAEADSAYCWKKDMDRNAEVKNKFEESVRCKIYGTTLTTANVAGDSRSKPCDKSMAPFKRGDSFPDLEWVDELVGYD